MSLWVWAVEFSRGIRVVSTCVTVPFHFSCWDGCFGRLRESLQYLSTKFSLGNLIQIKKGEFGIFTSCFHLKKSDVNLAWLRKAVHLSVMFLTDLPDSQRNAQCNSSDVLFFGGRVTHGSRHEIVFKCGFAQAGAEAEANRTVFDGGLCESLVLSKAICVRVFWCLCVFLCLYVCAQE